MSFGTKDMRSFPNGSGQELVNATDITAVKEKKGLFSNALSSESRLLDSISGSATYF